MELNRNIARVIIGYLESPFERYFLMRLYKIKPSLKRHSQDVEIFRPNPDPLLRSSVLFASEHPNPDPTGLEVTYVHERNGFTSKELKSTTISIRTTDLAYLHTEFPNLIRLNIESCSQDINYLIPDPVPPEVKVIIGNTYSIIAAGELIQFQKFKTLIIDFYPAHFWSGYYKYFDWLMSLIEADELRIIIHGFPHPVKLKFANLYKIKNMVLDKRAPYARLKLRFENVKLNSLQTSNMFLMPPELKYEPAKISASNCSIRQLVIPHITDHCEQFLYRSHPTYIYCRTCTTELPGSVKELYIMESTAERQPRIPIGIKYCLKKGFEPVIVDRT